MKVLVIGDSCEDVFIYGNCDRLAPAAPVPVFVETHRKSNKGMAGNVYENFLFAPDQLCKYVNMMPMAFI